MDLSEVEAKILQEAALIHEEIQVRELSDLTLAFVGGGIGTTVI